MRHNTHTISPKGRLICNKLDPGVFVVEVPENGRKISLGQPPDVVKRLQQVGYHGANGVTTFVLVDSKRQGDSISWCLTEFPILYALYFIMVEKNGDFVPAFYAGQKPMLAGLADDVRKALAMIKYGNYGMDSIDEIDGMYLNCGWGTYGFKATTASGLNTAKMVASGEIPKNIEAFHYNRFRENHLVGEKAASSVGN